MATKDGRATEAQRAETLLCKDPGWVCLSDTGISIATLVNGLVAIRNTANPEGPALIYTPDEIKLFVEQTKEGLFDHFL